MIPDKCASEERNVEKVRHKITVSNHSATRLVRNLGETKPNQSGSLFTIRCYEDHAEGLLLCYDILASYPSPTRNYLYCQDPPPDSSVNIEK